MGLTGHWTSYFWKTLHEAKCMSEEEYCISLRPTTSPQLPESVENKQKLGLSLPAPVVGALSSATEPEGPNLMTPKPLTVCGRVHPEAP